MGYDFQITGCVRVKKEGDYPWPAMRATPPQPDRTIHLFPDDVLTKNPDTGTYMRHTGLGCFNIILKDEEVEPIEGTVNLRLL